MGAMLIAVGMVASLLSSNVTVAFILGALFCGGAGLPRPARLAAGRRAPAADRGPVGPGPVPRLRHGVIPLSGVFYFVSLAAAMLYLNMVLLGRRHWAGGEASRGRWVHSLVRVVAVLLALVSLNVLVERAGRPRRRQRGAAAHALARVARPDQADPRRPAGLHPGVLQPRGPARVRRDQGRPARPAQGIRRHGAATGSASTWSQTELYSTEARDAEKRFGIEPRRVITTDEAQAVGRRRSSWASPSPRAWRRSSSRSSTAACRSSTS